MVDLWRRYAKDPSCFEVIIAVDGDDTNSLKAAQAIDKCKVVVQEELPGNCVKGWNLAAKNSVGKVLIAISDDFYPIRNWDQRILSVADRCWVDRRHVVMVNDGHTRDLCTLPIVTRTRYEELGYLFYPGYESMYCDTELTRHAELDGIVIRAMNLVFTHYHPDNMMRMKDHVDLNHSNGDRYARGERLFEQRRAQGFPKDI